jgi:hypothetical protein
MLFSVQTRRAEALAVLRIASPLHGNKETPGEAPGVKGAHRLRRPIHSINPKPSIQTTITITSRVRSSATFRGIGTG